MSGIEVVVPLPFRFVILENTSKICGGRDEGSNWLPYRSNWVLDKDLKKNAVFTVRSKHGVEITGSYDEVRKLTGTKFMTSLFIAYMDEGEMKIGSLEIAGSSLSSWIDLCKGVRNIYEGGFAITGSTKKKKGSNEYLAPIFERASVPVSIDEKACALHANVLMPYITAYLTQSAVDVVQAEAIQHDAATIDDDDDWSGPTVDAKAAFVKSAMDAQAVVDPETEAEAITPAPKAKGKAKAATAESAEPAFVTEPQDSDPWG